MDYKYLYKKGMYILIKRMHFKPTDIKLTGSVALAMYGLQPQREPHDIDICVRQNSESLGCLKFIAEVFQTNQRSTLTNVYAFQIDDIIFNVWVEDDVTTAITDSATGVYIDTPMHIFNTKKSYNRLKDIKDLSDIAKLILS